MTDKHGGFPPEWVKFDQDLFGVLVHASYIDENYSVPNEDGHQELLDFTISDLGKAYLDVRRTRSRTDIRSWVALILSVMALVISLLAALDKIELNVNTLLSRPAASVEAEALYPPIGQDTIP